MRRHPSSRPGTLPAAKKTALPQKPTLCGSALFLLCFFHVSDPGLPGSLCFAPAGSSSSPARHLRRYSFREIP